MDELEHDFIVIGAGSSGCVVANRLSKDPSNSVLLLEAGGPDTNPWIHIPVGYFRTMHNPAVDWCLRTESDPGLNGRSLEWPRGKVLGGSSSLNGLVYVRGQPEDYDRWAQMGNKGWSWDEVLPLFRRSEDQENGESELHGVGGPLKVSNMRLRRPICDAWVEAAQAAGHPFNPDCNGPRQDGVGYAQLTAHNGRRCSAAVAFLKPARNRPNLRIMTRAQTTRIEIRDGRATGVHFINAEGKARFARARAEIVLSAGAIGSPHVLMLSGVGDPEMLRQHGIDVALAAPEVGRNLQDHLQARLVYKCHEKTLNDEVRNLWGKAQIALQYALTRTGSMTMAASLAIGFMRTRPELATPDIQFHIQPWSADSPGAGVHPFSAFTVSVCQLRPESRGWLSLTSPDFRVPPAIHPNYLATENDRQTMLAGVRMAREISTHEPLKSRISSAHSPVDSIQDDDALLEWLRNTATTIYHPTGTCRMGVDDQAVLDPQLRLRGIEGLRVADCSIMPEIVSGNTNAPAIMIGEKVSDMILASASAYA